MSRRDVSVARTVAVVLATIIGLCDCGSSGPDAAATIGGKPKPGPAAQAPGRPDMVAAVSASKTPGLLEVRFALSARPVVGQPLDIQVALIPTVDLERVYARFQAGEGLDLVKGAETRHFEHATPGMALEHTLTVTARSDGIFYITATVVTDSATESVARNYSIPIIAGAGIPELPAANTPPPQPAPTAP